MRISAERVQPTTGSRHRGKSDATWHVHIRLESDKVEREVELHLDHIAKDVEKVLLNGRHIGFVHHVKPVYVALTGPDLARAVEISQKLTLDGSIRALLDTVPIETLTTS